jgi:hypothetical protein
MRSGRVWDLRRSPPGTRFSYYDLYRVTTYYIAYITKTMTYKIRSLRVSEHLLLIPGAFLMSVLLQLIDEAVRCISQTISDLNVVYISSGLYMYTLYKSTRRKVVILSYIIVHHQPSPQSTLPSAHSSAPSAPYCVGPPSRQAVRLSATTSSPQRGALLAPRRT